MTLGLDASGKSCIVEQGEIAPAAVPGRGGLAVAEIFKLAQSPPPASPPSQGHYGERFLGPGHVSCHIIEHAPRAETPGAPAPELHYSNSIDLVMVLDGGGTMWLGDGAHPFFAGDVWILRASDHVFTPGAQGCRLALFAIGAPPAQ